MSKSKHTQVLHFDLYGKRKHKYVFLATTKCEPFGMSKTPSGGLAC